MNLSTFILIITGLLLLTAAPVHAQDAEAPSDEELAKKLANPIFFVISVPFDFGYNIGLGPNDGDQISALPLYSQSFPSLFAGMCR